MGAKLNDPYLTNLAQILPVFSDPNHVYVCVDVVPAAAWAAATSRPRRLHSSSLGF